MCSQKAAFKENLLYATPANSPRFLELAPLKEKRFIPAEAQEGNNVIPQKIHFQHG